MGPGVASSSAAWSNSQDESASQIRKEHRVVGDGGAADGLAPRG
jgi:hypothetical protein